MTSLPKPIAMTKDTVVLSRAAWKKIGDALEAADDRAAAQARQLAKACDMLTRGFE